MRYGIRWNIALSVGLAMSFVAGANAEVSSQRATAMARLATRFDSLSRQMPEAARKRLSSGTQNYMNLSRRWNDVENAINRASLRGRAFGGLRAALPEEISPAAPINISLQGVDKLLFSRLAGFVQSETSTAWCNTNLLTGFNDSGSVIDALLSSPSESLSFDGYARSTNTGTSFADAGALLPDPLPLGVKYRDLEGDPVVGCSTKNNFFFATLAVDTLNDLSQVSGVTVSASTNGGATFGGAVMAVGKDAATHIIDKDWMVVDPTNLTRIYVTYTDFDFSAILCGKDINDDPILRTAIEIVSSADGGVTWTSPVIVKEVCLDAGLVQGSQVAVGPGPGAEVFVAYEFYDASDARRIEIAKSTDQSQSFATPVVVDNVTPVGSIVPLADGSAQQVLQGAFRTNEWPSLGIDRSGKAFQNTIYVAWNDGRNLPVPEFLSLTDSYNYSDILVSRSVDGGATWSSPVRVNSNTEPLPTGLGTDQFEPGLAVDQNTGNVGVCFYDRRRDAKNFLIDRECAKSTNRGNSWTNTSITPAPFAPEIDQDLFVASGYMGDYDTLAADFKRVTAGFFGAWGDNARGNPDIRGSKF